MPTLENIQANALAPDFISPFEQIENIFNRRRALDQQDRSLDQSDRRLGLQEKQVDIQGIGLISQLDPNLGKAVAQVIGSGDVDKMTELHAKAQEASKFFGVLQTIDNKPLRDMEIRKQSQKLIEAGETQEGIDLLKMVDMDDDQQNLQIALRQAKASGIEALPDIVKARNVKKAQDKEALFNQLARVRNAPTEEQASILSDIISENVRLGKDTRLLEGLRADPTSRTRTIDAILSQRGPGKITAGKPGDVFIDEFGNEVKTIPAKVDDKPLTNIGKAREDLKAGRINQKEFDLIAGAPDGFKSTVGKLIADKKLSDSMFGADSPQSKAIGDALKSETQGEGPKFTEVSGVRKEFTKLSGDFITVRDAFKKVQNTNEDAAGDVAMIFNFMKILDPGSVVREGEQATAQNAAGVVERVRNMYNRLLTGENLTPEQRRRFRDQAGKTFEAQLETHLQQEKVFRKLSDNLGIPPEKVVIDFVGDFRGKKNAGVVEPPQELSPLQKSRLDALRKKQGAK